MAGHLTLQSVEVLTTGIRLPQVPSDEGGHLFSGTSPRGALERLGRQQPKGRSPLTERWYSH